jgi:Flp pilus assembly pilin Flp
MSLEVPASRSAPGALRGLAANRRGAALAEYALLLGLFLAVLAGVLIGMGSHLQSLFGKANTELHSGDCASGNCSVASGPGSGGSGGSSGGGSSPNEGGSSGSSGASGSSGGGEPSTPPNPGSGDQSGGGSGVGGSEPPPSLDTYPH